MDGPDDLAVPRADARRALTLLVAVAEQALVVLDEAGDDDTALAASITSARDAASTRLERGRTNR